MTKKYKVIISNYSLNELTSKLGRAIYGNNVIVGASDVVPALSNLIEADPDDKGVAWELDYRSQADRLSKWLNRVLTGEYYY